MIRVCPLPTIWAKIFGKLGKLTSVDPTIPEPPIALILAGWNFSDDFEKKNRWDDTLEWINKYGGEVLTTSLTDNDYYCVEKLSRPAYLDYQCGETSPPAIRPADDELTNLLKKLSDLWGQIVGNDSRLTMPSSFTGAKARSLIVEYDSDELPAWGTWGNEPGGYYDQNFTNKASFTALRQRINDAIHPHKIDHVVFHRKK
jgi:hypothetical protein